MRALNPKSAKGNPCESSDVAPTLGIYCGLKLLVAYRRIRHLRKRAQRSDARLLMWRVSCSVGIRDFLGDRMTNLLCLVKLRVNSSPRQSNFPRLTPRARTQARTHASTPACSTARLDVRITLGPGAAKLLVGLLATSAKSSRGKALRGSSANTRRLPSPKYTRHRSQHSRTPANGILRRWNSQSSVICCAFHPLRDF